MVPVSFFFDQSLHNGKIVPQLYTEFFRTEQPAFIYVAPSGERFCVIFSSKL